MPVENAQLEADDIRKNRDQSDQKTTSTLRESYKFSQGILGSDGAIEIKESDRPAQSFIFLNMNSGMDLMISMIHLHSHLT